MKGINQELLRQFLDGDLSPEEEVHALKVLAEDDAARKLLRFDAGLRAVLAHPEMSVPPGFGDRVMREISTSSPGPAGGIALARVKQLLNYLIEPRPLQWRPAYAFVFAGLILLSALLAGGQKGSWVVPFASESTSTTHVASFDTEERVPVRFAYESNQATSVAVAGDFSLWEPVSLTREVVHGSIVWSAIVSVPRGEHRYMFVIDESEWITDPLAPMHLDDGFGNNNAVLKL